MFRSSVEYKNRSGVAYTFEKLSEYEYLFQIEDFGYGRMGGKEGQEKPDWSDLGMFDPAGGPYIALGTVLDDQEIVRISWHEDGFIVEVA